MYRGGAAIGAVFLALLACAVAVLPTAASGGERRTDPDDVAGPLDLAQVRLQQSGPRMKLLARTHGQWRPRALDDEPDLTLQRPQSYLCFEFRQREERRRACLGKKEGRRPHLTLLRIGAGGAVKSSRRLRGVRVRHPNAKTLRAVGRLRNLKLHVGRLRWRWLSGWGEDRCAPPPPQQAPGGALPLPPPPPPPPPPPECDDRYPNGDAVKGRVKRPRIVGCTRDEDTVNRNASRSRRSIALTFDDGPSAYTDNVLDILDRYRVKGTFFVVGHSVPGRPGLLRRMVRDRHEIGNHSMHHESTPGSASIKATNSRIRSASGFRPCTFRPPYGAKSGSTRAAAWNQGMSSILWDVDPLDWQRPGSGAIYSRVVTNARSGSIVLMHDGGGDRSQTVAALPRIVRTLKDRGYELVTVTRLLRERIIWRP